MSERERVRLLFESAIMNARAVISDMKTVKQMHEIDGHPHNALLYFHKLYKTKLELRSVL